MKRKSFIKKLMIIAGCLSIVFIFAILLPNFMHAGYVTASNACINNLRQIDAAKNQWGLENGKTNGIVTEADIKPYFKNGNLPKCPEGGKYDIGQVGEDPRCSIGTSVWPNSHVLNETNNWWTNFKGAYRRLYLKPYRGH